MFRALALGAKAGAKAAPRLMKAGARTGARYGKAYAKTAAVQVKQEARAMAENMKNNAFRLANNIRADAKTVATNYLDTQRRRIYQTDRGAIYTNTSNNNRNYDPTPAYHNVPGTNVYKPLY